MHKQAITRSQLTMRWVTNSWGVGQAPMLDLLHKHLDAKGKQAKLKSPQELQELLDVTRQLLAEHDEAARSDSATPDERAELDEIQEKFRIVKVQPQHPFACSFDRESRELLIAAAT